MRLNSATLNGRRFNIGPTIYPTKFSSDSIGIVASALDATRYANGAAAAVAELRGDFLASALRYFSGDVVAEVDAELLANAVRSGAGTAIVEAGGSLFYTRLIYGSGGAEVRIIAISDVGVVYGEGSGVAMPTAMLDGARVRVSSGEAIATTDGSLAASAIRVPATEVSQELVPLIAQLDTAHISAGGIRYINGGADAYAYLEIEDAGMRRQVFIGSMDLEPMAAGSATAIRHGKGDALVTSTMLGTFEATRRGEGSGIVRGISQLDGEVLVRFSGDAVIELAARMTGYVYRRGGVLNAISTLAAELNGARTKASGGSAIAITVMDASANIRKLASGTSVIELNAESTAADFNFSGEDDDTEVFYRPSMQREFYRAAIQREWRRS